MPSGKIRIVTDSSVQFLDPTFIRRSGITVVPLGIRIGGQVYREDLDLDAAGFIAHSAAADSPAELIAPDVETFTSVYTRLGQTTNRILSIHLSRQIHGTWQQAKNAASMLIGGVEIAVLDSQTTSVGLGFLIEAAVELATQIESLDEIVRTLRKMIPRIYAIFCSETLDALRMTNLVSESQAIIGGMLGVKPILTIEEGELIAMEKVRSHGQALDHFIEFVTEFGDVNQLVILQSTPHASEFIRLLQDRLLAEYSPKKYPLVVYKPSLGTLIGPHAVGIIIFENESAIDDSDDDEDQDEDEDNGDQDDLEQDSDEDTDSDDLS